MKRLRRRVRELDERRRHRAAARALLRADPEPESWLDVGTGDARFPAALRAHFPYTAFDGLDPSPRVERARADERIEEAHVGRPADPHIVSALAGRYDVVSLRHPGEGLGAALALVRPGGHLLVETTAEHAGTLRAELTARHCAVLPSGRHPLLDRLSRAMLALGFTHATRLVARRAPDPAAGPATTPATAAAGEFPAAAPHPRTPEHEEPAGA